MGMTVFLYQSLDDWQTALKQEPGLNGLSPGGVAGHLGVTRQAVHAAVKSGRLDAVRVSDGGELRFILITNDSLQRFVENPNVKGRPPSVSGHWAMLKDQVKYRVW